MSKAALARAAQELSVLEFARDLEGVIQEHRLFASERRASAKRPRGRRTADELETLALARILESLTKQYPRFESEIRKLQWYVRKQLTPGQVRRREILTKVEEGELLDEEELLEATRYDKQTLRSDIKLLVKAKQIEEVTRDGRAPRRHRDGHPTDRVYYRVAGPSGKMPDRR